MRSILWKHLFHLWYQHFPFGISFYISHQQFLIFYDFILTGKDYETAVSLEPSHGGCQVNGPKVAKFLDR